MTHDASQAMTHRTARTPRADDGRSAGAAQVLLARTLLGMLFLALVALASLAPARAASTMFGWVPLWLLLVPGSAWFALHLRRRYAAGAAYTADGAGRRRGGTGRPARLLQAGAAAARAAMATQRRPRAARGAQLPRGSALAVSRRGSTQPGRTKWQV
jgi:hypothetical protein